MRKFLKDLGVDLSMILLEVLVVVVKVAMVYLIIKTATDLDHQVALETAILVGAVDFLNGQRTRFRTVSDVKEKITLTERGKKITQTITKHTQKG